jgi:protease II
MGNYISNEVDDIMGVSPQRSSSSSPNRSPDSSPNRSPVRVIKTSVSPDVPSTSSPLGPSASPDRSSVSPDRSGAPSPESVQDSQPLISIGSKRGSPDREGDYEPPAKRKRIIPSTQIDSDDSLTTTEEWSDFETPQIPTSTENPVQLIWERMRMADSCNMKLPSRHGDSSYEWWEEKDDSMIFPVIYYRNIITDETEMLIDFNEFAQSEGRGDIFQIENLKISKDMRYVAFSIRNDLDSDFSPSQSRSDSYSDDESSTEIISQDDDDRDELENSDYTIYIYDVVADEVLDRIYDAMCHFIWGPDSESIIYAIQDGMFSDVRIYDIHTMTDQTIYSIEGAYYLSPKLTASRSYMMITKQNETSHEVMISPIERYRDSTAYRLVRFSQKNILYDVDSVTYDREDGEIVEILIMLEFDQSNNTHRLMYADPSALIQTWTEILRTQNFEIKRMIPIHNYILFQYTLNNRMRVGYYHLDGEFALRRIKPLDSLDRIERYINVPYNTTFIDHELSYHSSTVRIADESTLTSPQITEVSLPGNSELSEANFVDMETIATTTFDPDLYDCRIIKVPSSRNDGSMISMTMVYHRNQESELSAPSNSDSDFESDFGNLTSDRPVLLMTYDTSIDSQFDHRIVPLLNAQYVVCLVHPVSFDHSNFNAFDQEFYLHVMNCADNTVDCLRYLNDKGVTSPQLTVVQTLNESGALMPLIINRGGELFTSGLMDAPYGDCFINDPDYSSISSVPSGTYPSTFLTINDVIHPDYLDSLINYQRLLGEADPSSQHIFMISSDDDYIRAKQYIYAINCCAINCIIGMDGEVSNSESDSIQPLQSTRPEPYYPISTNHSESDSDSGDWHDDWDVGFDSV